MIIHGGLIPEQPNMCAKTARYSVVMSWMRCLRSTRERMTKMENMVNVYFFGKKYSVPADLTIMTAMEYAGYTLKRGCGCRHGFCGACATIYRIKGKNELKTCLACQTQVQEGMYVASIPFFPTDKRTYDINDLKPGQHRPLTETELRSIFEEIQK